MILERGQVSEEANQRLYGAKLSIHSLLSLA